MDIYINGTPLDFTLEKETRLSQVMNSIDQWLQESRMGVTEVKINGKDEPVSQKREWQEINLEEVSRLDLTVLGIAEIKAGEIQTLFDYFDILKQALLSEPPAPKLGEILAEWPYVEKSLPPLLGEFPSPAGTSLLDPLKKNLDTSGLLTNRPITAEAAKELVKSIEPVMTLLNNRLKEILQPRRELESANTLLMQMLPQVSEVSILLQTGKDQQAMTLVIHFSELLSRILRLLQELSQQGLLSIDTILMDQMPFKEFYQEMNQVLSELVDAFEANDTVLIGDLLEYEVVPRAEKIPSMLPQISSGEETS